MTIAWGAETDVALAHPGVADILAELDATAAYGRDRDAIRKDRDPRIPKLEHSLSNDWRPPPSKDEVLKRVDSAACCRQFKRHSRPTVMELFRKEGILPPKVLGVWEAGRVANATPARSIGNPPGKAGVVKYHQHSDPLPEPFDEQLHPQHGEWLKAHRVQRTEHLYPIHHALKKVEKAVAKEKEVQTQRETARDVMTRGALTSPKFSAGVKSKLSNAKGALKTMSQFNKLTGCDVVRDQEKKDKRAMLRAMSDPCLELKPSTPRHRPKHLRSWKGPDRRWAWTQTDVCLKHTTPGVSQEEDHELHTIPKYRARGA